MNYFIRVVQTSGGHVQVEYMDKDNTCLRWSRVSGNCKLYEKQVKYRQLGGMRSGSMQSAYESVYTGELVLEVYLENGYGDFAFSDTSEKSLEDQIGEIFRNI
ncbi:hypothetical protein LQZ18_03615 [Lachnospiraceae bacterium ZAX-1]